jgi:hypothetical protein
MVGNLAECKIDMHQNVAQLKRSPIYNNFRHCHCWKFQKVGRIVNQIRFLEVTNEYIHRNNPVVQLTVTCILMTALHIIIVGLVTSSYDNADIYSCSFMYKALSLIMNLILPGTKF